MPVVIAKGSTLETYVCGVLQKNMLTWGQGVLSEDTVLELGGACTQNHLVCLQQHLVLRLPQCRGMGEGRAETP